MRSLRLVDTVSPVGHVLDVPFGSGRFAAGLLARGLASLRGWTLPRTCSQLPDQCCTPPVSILARSTSTSVMHEPLPYEDDAFELVLCVRFLQSVLALGDVPVVLGELRRVARTAVIVQLRDPEPGLRIRAQKVPSERMEHQCTASDADLLLSAAGLSVERDVREEPAGSAGLRLVLCRPSAPRPELAATVLDVAMATRSQSCAPRQLVSRVSRRENCTPVASEDRATLHAGPGTACEGAVMQAGAPGDEANTSIWGIRPFLPVLDRRVHLEHRELVAERHRIRRDV